MRRADMITLLEHRATEMRAMGATSLYPFGSVARDEAASGSDLDLFIEYDPTGGFNAFNLVGIKLFLQEELHTEVDVTTRDALHPMLRERIEGTAIRIF